MNKLIRFRFSLLVAILLFTIAALFIIASMTITTAIAKEKPAHMNVLQTNVGWTFYQDEPNLARRGMAAVYDSHRKVVVMFGGEDMGSVFNETWEFDGTKWQQIITPHKPPARFWHGMAYDSERQVVVLFGGYDDQTRFDDTWEYDGSDWVQVITIEKPQPLSAFGMTYDSCRKKTVLYSGYVNWGTWEYDGMNWEKIVVIDSPEYRHLASMTFDSARCQTVLFAGMGEGAQGRNDTWEYNGINWIKILTNDSPPPRWAHALAYDPLREKTILFGGYGQNYPDGGALDDTWEYDGENWNVINTTSAPAAREQHILVYDGNLQKALLFGGFGNGDTWFYSDQFLVYLPLVVR